MAKVTGSNPVEPTPTQIHAEAERGIARFWDANRSTCHARHRSNRDDVNVASSPQFRHRLERAPRSSAMRVAADRARSSAASNHAGHNEHGTAELRLVEDLHSIGREPEERIGAHPRRLPAPGAALPL